MSDDTGGGAIPQDAPDPRPLLGEPLALDLVNTRWMSPAGRQDLLTDVPGLAVWLRGAGLADSCDADAATLVAVRQTRDALIAVINDPLDVTAINGVLDHGRVRRAIVDGVPVDETELDDPAWRPGWLAADNYVQLVRHRPDRIRPCANSDCILHFFDTSKNGTRRWCSMAGCGNRAKAARHYDRSRARPQPRNTSGSC